MLLQAAPRGTSFVPKWGAQKRGGQGEAQGSSTPGALEPRATSYSLQSEATYPHCLPNLQVHHLLWLSTPPVPTTTWPSPSLPLHPLTCWTAPPLLMELLSSQGLRPLNHQHIPSHIALRRPQDQPTGFEERAQGPQARGWSGAGATYADPRVLQCLVCRDALGGVDGQHLVDEVFGFGSDRVPLRGWELERKTRHRGA